MVTNTNSTTLDRRSSRSTLRRRVVTSAVSVALLASACGGSDRRADGAVASSPEEQCPTITLATHDSFVVSEGLFESFTEQTCIKVTTVSAGDTGALVSSAILTKDNPTADVLFGIDNTFLQRGLDAGLFESYRSPLLSTVDPDAAARPRRASHTY